MRAWAALGALSGLALGVWIGLTGVDSNAMAAATAGFVLACLGVPLGLYLGLVAGALRRSPHFVPYFALGALALAAFVFARRVPEIRFQYRLRAEGVRTRATVVRAMPRDHDSIHDSVLYRYSTPSGERTGRGSPPTSASARPLAPGDPLDVLYLRGEPERSTTREPADTWASAVGVALASGVLGASWFVFVREVRRRRWNPRRYFRWG